MARRRRANHERIRSEGCRVPVGVFGPRRWLQGRRSREERAMAGSRRKGNTGSRKRAGQAGGSASKRRAADRPASEYAREAVSEWGKAVRYAASALRPANGPSLKERLSAQSARGGRLGDAADA